MSADIISRLEAGPGGSRELDIAICEAANDCALRDTCPGLCPAYSTSVDAALTLIPDDWWWHASHLEVIAIPTTSPKEMPISNAFFYEKNGRPIRFSSMAHYNRKGLPLALCSAFFQALRALEFPRPIPRKIYGKAISLLRRKNPNAKWAMLEFQHKAHWIAAALKARG